LQPHLSVFAVIGICHSSETDIIKGYQQLRVQAKRFQRTVLITRLFTFEPTVTQLDLHASKLSSVEDVVCFPSDRIVDGRSIVSFHMEVVITNMCSILIQNIDLRIRQIQGSGDACGGLTLSYPGDTIDSIGSKKRLKKRLARSQKVIADLCLLAGSPADALEHYQEV